MSDISKAMGVAAQRGYHLLLLQDGGPPAIPVSDSYTCAYSSYGIVPSTEVFQDLFMLGDAMIVGDTGCSTSTLMLGAYSTLLD